MYKDITVITSLIVLTNQSWAEELSRNRFSLSARFPFNISGQIKNTSQLPAFTPAPQQTTPNGDPYNYDDGYVLTDIGDNAGLTWYWGYNNSSQISGDTIFFTRTTTWSSVSSTSTAADPKVGIEMTYNRLIGAIGKAQYGLEAAINYLRIDLSNTSNFSRNSIRVTDGYQLSGLVPPLAPYQGTFEGPGPLIGDTVISQSMESFSGPFWMDKQKFRANLWGARLGPYQEFSLGNRINVLFSGGLALGLLEGNFDWSRTIGKIKQQFFCKFDLTSV